MTRKNKINRSGYWYIYSPTSPMSSKQGYVAEHRLVMSESIGRPLRREEAVHHVDGDKRNNKLDNLELFATHGQHTKHRHPEVYEKARKASLGKKPPNYNRGTRVCPVCKASFETTFSPSGKTYCSRSCVHKNAIGRKPKNAEGLKLGRGWNKGKPMTWQRKGKDSPNYKHGKYSKYL